MTERVKWIDFSKVIGIWLVVLGHMGLANATIINIIYSFHMPLFFFISGYLVKPKSLKNTIKKNFIALIIPYVIYYVLTWIWWIFVSYLRHPELFNHEHPVREIFIKPILGLLLGVGYNTDISTMINVPLWFLISLFFVSILFSLLQKITNKYFVILIVLIEAIVSYALSVLQIDLLFSVDSSLMAFPFYVLGYYGKNVLNNENIFSLFQKKKFLKLIVQLIIFSSILIITTIYNGRVDINGLSFGKNPLIFYISGMSGIVCVVIVSILFSKFYNDIIITISNGTLFIMAFHGIITGLLLLPLKMMHLDDNIIAIITVSLLVIVISIPIISLVKKKYPMLIGNRTTAST